MHVQTDAVKGRFLKGMLLGWVPFLIFIVPALMNTFRGISSAKATGLGAVAGGLAEGLVIFGFTAFVICEIFAIVLLARTFSKEHRLRGFLSVVSIFWSALMLAVMCVALGMLIAHAR